MTENWLPRRQDWLRLCRRVRVLTRRKDAEDHLQSAIVNYLERPEGSIEHPEAYITRSALNLSHNTRKREQVSQIASVSWEDILIDVRDARPSQEEAYESRQKLEHFYAGCQQLPERTRQVFLEPFWKFAMIGFQEVLSVIQRQDVDASTTRPHGRNYTQDETLSV
ncbi:transcriptional regulator [Acetobacter sp. AC2005]|uniref:transcriptional regulator n=1 Tax=Acetobacter sp. AC2005 TaxID=3134142 RepID=UPI0030D35B7E